MEKTIQIYLRKNVVHYKISWKIKISKPTDKGSAIVIWDGEDYLKECNEQWSNESICEKCNEFRAIQLNKEIPSTLSSMLSKK